VKELPNQSLQLTGRPSRGGREISRGSGCAGPSSLASRIMSGAAGRRRRRPDS
jgi:hypothetical protein